LIKGQTLGISRGISSCRDYCHIPEVPWLWMLRSGLRCSSAPPGKQADRRRRRAVREQIRALQR
ncbi:Hypothetical predicted protein, partial [Xyrichtys novacula]